MAPDPEGRDDRRSRPHELVGTLRVSHTVCSETRFGNIPFSVPLMSPVLCPSKFQDVSHGHWPVPESSLQSGIDGGEVASRAAL